MDKPYPNESGLEVVNTDMQGLQPVTNNTNDGSMYSSNTYNQQYAGHWAKTDRETVSTPIPSEYKQTPATAYATPAEIYNSPQHAPAQLSEPKRGGRPVPFGLNPWLFAAIAALIGMIISGALVGGILGAQLAASPSPQAAAQTTEATSGGNAPPSAPSSGSTPSSGSPGSNTSPSSSRSSPSPTSPTTSLSDYTVAAPADVKRLRMDCPGLNGKSIVSTFDKKRFNVECHVDSQGQGAEAPGALSVIGVHYAYNLEACLDACAVLNKRSAEANRDLKCRLVVFHAGMSDNVDKGGNCFLKNATRADGNKGNTNDRLLTANLVDN